jgi:hypothetical protein
VNHFARGQYSADPRGQHRKILSRDSESQVLAGLAGLHVALIGWRKWIMRGWKALPAAPPGHRLKPVPPQGVEISDRSLTATARKDAEESRLKPACRHKWRPHINGRAVKKIDMGG